MYSTWIKRLEQEKNLSERERFEIDKRISWDEIKEYIVTTFAVATLGSYNFITLYITSRKDNVDFHEWCITVSQIRETIIAHENWELVADRECLPWLCLWLTNREFQVLEQELHRKNLHSE